MITMNSYTCDCGRTFIGSQSFNGHKSHCLVHLTAVNKLEDFYKAEQIRHNAALKTITALTKVKFVQKQEELEQWMSEQHTCERCGKIMTEKFGSGRFCSRACANMRKHSETTKQKISYSLKAFIEANPEQVAELVKTKHYSNGQSLEKNIADYLLKPTRCCVCGAELTYKHRNQKTCSTACKRKYLSELSLKAVQFHEGNLNPAPNKNCKSGFYKGIHCDSSWELAYLVYCLEHDIIINRNKTGFKYFYNDKEHTYYPDFIVDNVYVEIKNYWTEQVQAKIDYFPKELSYKILYKKDIKPMLDYCIDKYGKYFWKTLYE